MDGTGVFESDRAKKIGDEVCEWIRVNYVEPLGAAREDAGRLVTAIDLTRQFVGEDVLPAVEGWSWYDAIQAHEALLAAEGPL